MTTNFTTDAVTSRSPVAAFGYLRVSGRGQLDKDGETRQKATIAAFAERKGYRVVRWFFDGAVSGDLGVLDRPEFAGMLALTGDATTRTILVERGDRLGRSLMVSELACMEASKQGVTIWDCSAGIDLTNDNTPDKVFLRQIVGAAAQLNKNLAVQRMAAARNRIRQTQGRCEGRKPFGNRTDAEVEVVDELIRLRDEKGLGWGAIAKKMTRDNHVGPSGDTNWSRFTVRDVYLRETEIREAVSRKSRAKGNLPIKLEGLGL